MHTIYRIGPAFDAPGVVKTLGSHPCRPGSLVRLQKPQPVGKKEKAHLSEFINRTDVRPNKAI
jgi:hypothetical protein